MLPPETESVEENTNESVDSPEEESEQEEIPDAENDWELAGDEIPGIPIPDDWVEEVNEPDQEPDQWPDGEWVDPEDLAGEEISEIPIPDDWVEDVSEPDQEPDQWPDGEWADPEDLASEEISEIPIPDDWVEVVEEPDQEPENIPELDPDQWPQGDWADPEDLAGEEIYPIPIPDDWVEIVEETDQEPIESPIQEENQEKEEIIVYATSENSSSDFLELKNFIAEIATQEKSQDIQKSLEITTENQESKRELNSKKDEKEANKELKETKEKDFITNKETNEIKAEIKKKEDTSSEIQNEKTQEISKELKEKYKEQTGRRPIYAGKITKGFEEWLKEQQESEKENQEKDEQEEIKEDWEILLEKWINDADENEISKEVKDELIEIIKNYREVRKIEKLLMALLAKSNPTEEMLIEIEKLIEKVYELTNNQEELFITFERFKAFYNKTAKDRITEQKVRFVKHLAQKLRRLKDVANDENALLNYNWKAFIKANIDLIKELNENDKELVSKIINKADISKEERRKLISILTKLDTEQLIKIFGETFKHHTKNYIKWGWDFDRGVKRLMLNAFLKPDLENITYNKEVIQVEKSNNLSFNQRIFEYLSNRNKEIEDGTYIPRFNDFKSLPDFKNLTRKNFNTIRNKWFNENLNINFKDYISKLQPSLKSKLFDYLNRKLKEIQEGIYIPLYKDLKKDLQFRDINEKSFNRIRRDWYIENIGKNFSSYHPSLIKKIFNYLSQKIDEIREGTYIPMYQDFINIPKFKNLNEKTFRHARYQWYKKHFNKSFNKYSLQFEYTIKAKLYNYLFSRKKQIEQRKFIPKLNIIKKNQLFRALSNTTILEIRDDWYKENFGIPYLKYHPYFKELLCNFLSNPNIISKIKRCKFIPRYKFFKEIQEFSGMSSYTFIQIRRQWFEEQFNTKFIKYYTKKTRHKIEFYKFRDKSSFIRPNYKSKRHRTLKLIIQLGRCLLTGKPLKANYVDFHHIDYDPTNDDKNNIGFIDRSIHQSKVHPLNLNITKKILYKNLRDLLNGKIPKMWRKEGINLSKYEKNKLSRRKKSNNIIIKKYNEL